MNWVGVVPTPFFCPDAPYTDHQPADYSYADSPCTDSHWTDSPYTEHRASDWHHPDQEPDHRLAKAGGLAERGSWEGSRRAPQTVSSKSLSPLLVHPEPIHPVSLSRPLASPIDFARNARIMKLDGFLGPS